MKVTGIDLRNLWLAYIREGEERSPQLSRGQQEETAWNKLAAFLGGQL